MSDKDIEIKAIKDIAKILDECCNYYDEQGRHLGNKCSDCEYWCDTNNICCSYNIKQAEALYHAGLVLLTDDNVEEFGNMIVTSPQVKETMEGLIKAWQKETAIEILQEFALTPRTKAMIMNKYGLSKEDFEE